jgi:hypothetical protein
MKPFAFVLFFFLVFLSPSRAQNYFALLQEGSMVSAGIHANPHLNGQAEYFHALRNSINGVERFGLMAQAQIPLFSQKGLDWDFRLGLGALIPVSGNFKAIMGLSWNFSRTEDLNGRYLHSGFKLDLFPGYYGKKWAFAPHLAYQYQPWIHIRHADYSVKSFQNRYPDGKGAFNSPKNGWFWQSYSCLQFGMAVAFRQPSWQINLTAGFQHFPNRLGLVSFPDIGILPFYGGLQFGYRLGKKSETP